MFYFDNAATTKPYPEVVKRVAEVSSATLGNASSPHALGGAARELIEESRATIAQSLGVSAEELYFTSGGTEANNLAIRGAFLALLAQRGAEGAPTPSLVISELEHPSVTRTIRDFKRAGTPVSYIPARGGLLDMAALAKALTGTAPVGLLSFMMVQNVFGYRFSLSEVARLRNEYAPQALLHSDAVQAYGRYTLRPVELGIDLLSVSAHKIGGPQGVGALYVRKGVSMFTTAFGGGQERGLRSGTEPVALIAGFAKAVEIAQEAQKGTTSEPASLVRLRTLWNHLACGLKERFSDVLLNSREDGSPSILHFSLPGLDNEKAVVALSEQGFHVGISSACDTSHIRPDEAIRPKHPLVARLAGLSAEEQRGSFRVSFGYDTQLKDIDALLDALVRYRQQGIPGGGREYEV